MAVVRTPIHVKVVALPNGVVLSSPLGDIEVTTTHPELSDLAEACDYAAWYFLPVAMRLDRPLHIAGRGTSKTIENWQKLTAIWQGWLPGHFYEQRLTFDQVSVSKGKARRRSATPDLLYYSGGLDAAHAGLMRLAKGQKQHLLTVQGMDYNVKDRRRFAALLSKTETFTRELSDIRIVVKSDAYVLYNKLGVNFGRHHLIHAFALAGAGFFHAKTYANLLLADDEPLAIQFLGFPWGTNAATNALFDDGGTKFVTLERDASRLEKIRTVFASETAMRSLAFCWNRSIQPENCGMCEKCLRTKLLSLAEFGEVPDIFRNKAIPQNWAFRFTHRGTEGFFFVKEIFDRARMTGHEGCFPDFERSVQTLIRRYELLRRLEKIWPSILHTGLAATLLAKLPVRSPERSPD